MCELDRRRKFPVTVLLKALGYTTEDLLEMFYDLVKVRRDKGGKYLRGLDIEKMAGQRALSDIVDPKLVKFS